MRRAHLRRSHLAMADDADRPDCRRESSGRALLWETRRPELSPRGRRIGACAQHVLEAEDEVEWLQAQVVQAREAAEREAAKREAAAREAAAREAGEGMYRTERGGRLVRALGGLLMGEGGGEGA